MGLKYMLEEFSRSRLPTFGHPIVGYENVSVRSPHSFDEDRLWGHGDMAGRSAGYGRKTGEGLITVVASIFRAQCCPIELDFGTDSANPASVGIDDTAAYGNTSR